MLIDTRGNIHGAVCGQYPLHHPHPSWAEQDANQWWSVVCTTTRQLLEYTGVDPQKIAGLVFSCMMATTVPVDEAGEPLRPAILWLDSRSHRQARQIVDGILKIKGYGLWRLLMFLRRTGGVPSLAGKDTISKIQWIRENEPAVAKRTAKYLDCKDFLIHRCTGRFVTSRDLASLSWMMDTRRGHLGWSERILALLDLAPEKLPAIETSTTVVGEVTDTAATALGIPAGTPVVNGAGDMAAALIGSGAVSANEVHTYIGTSGWVAAPVTRRLLSISDYIGSIWSADPDKYMCIAEQEVSGAAFDWFRTQLCANETYAVLDELAAAVPPGAGKVIFTPWMFGERSPIDDHYVRGGFFNLSLETTREQMVRAVMEGVAYHIRWMLDALEALLAKENASVDWMNIIGGGAVSDIWCQIIADVTHKRIRRVAAPRERVSVGAALIACVALGYDRCCEDLCHKIDIVAEFEPIDAHQAIYAELYAAFKRLYRDNAALYRELNTDDADAPHRRQ